MSPLTSVVLSRISGKGTWNIGHHPRDCNSKRSTYHQWCALPTKRALVAHLPNILPKYMSLDLPCDVIRSVARFRLRVHTLRVETVTWNYTPPPPLPVTSAMLMTFKMSSMSFFTAPILIWFLSAGIMHLCFETFPHQFPLCVCFSEPEQAIFFPS